jgi:hypothetical protein
MTKLLATVACACIALGCGSVVVPGDASGASSGSGGVDTSTSAVSSSASGMGGNSSTGTFTSSVTTGTGGGAACNDATVFVEIVGDGPVQHFDASCAPEGHLVWPGGPTPPGPPEPPTYLSISACPLAKGGGPFSIGAGYMMWPGTSNNANASYLHAGAMYSETPASSGVLEVTKLEMVGGVIEGAFTVTVASKTAGGMPIMLAGKFRVCRGPNLIPV